MKLLRNKYRWLAILVALWTRGVGFVIGAPPETVDFKTTSFTPLPVVLTEEKDTLIFSDSPEYVIKAVYWRPVRLTARVVCISTMLMK